RHPGRLIPTLDGGRPRPPRSLRHPSFHVLACTQLLSAPNKIVRGAGPGGKRRAVQNRAKECDRGCVSDVEKGAGRDLIGPGNCVACLSGPLGESSRGPKRTVRPGIRGLLTAGIWDVGCDGGDSGCFLYSRNTSIGSKRKTLAQSKKKERKSVLA
ncbi:hypothetical protein N7517_004581, partial [Penicillium concentricum]